MLAWDGRKFYKSAAYRVPVVDTTGAGDIFRAGFIYGLLQGWGLVQIESGLQPHFCTRAIHRVPHSAKAKY